MKMNNGLEEMTVIPMVNKLNRITAAESCSRDFVIKIWREISDPEDFADEISCIENAQEGDFITLDICSPGGRLDTAMLIIRAIRNSNCPVIAKIGPDCSSAASCIALSCHGWVVDESSSLMAHTCSYSPGWGKEVDIAAHVDYTRKMNKKFMSEIYQGFLETDEISDLLKGTPFYFDSEELAARLDVFTQYRMAQEEEEGCGNPDCEECGFAEETPLTEEEISKLLSEPEVKPKRSRKKS